MTCMLLTVEVIYSDSNVIHTYVTYMNANSGFHYSFVYGNPVNQQRKLLWESLIMGKT